MRFWDTSALVPLVVAERDTRRTEKWLRQDPVVVVWTLTRVELLSALARRRRLEARDASQLLAARRDVLQAWELWTEITAVEAVRHEAERLVEMYPLRAADALQIGAALVAAEGTPASLEFVTFDAQQAAAALNEGLRVLGARP